ncbi:hypothetical protein LVX13_03205 [Streptomyces albulus]|nr:hypothetical protein [Streptomyces noursei]MCE4942142.1 hypothetical protein [Streptomyces noursei]
MSELERITARRSEPDMLADELGKQLQEVQAEREDLVIAERVLQRLAEQDRALGRGGRGGGPGKGTSSTARSAVGAEMGVPPHPPRSDGGHS